MELFNLLTAVIGLCFFLLIVLLIRRDHLHIRYSIWWLSVATVVALFGVFPEVNDAVANALGIAYPPILPVIVAVLLLLSRLFLSDLESSRRAVELTRLVQKLAIVERRLEGLEQTQSPGEGDTQEESLNRP